MSKIPVYFIPGLAASPAIFKNIKLDQNIFDTHIIEWLIPEENESIENYSMRMSEKIKEENAILIGVSFGGVIAQEIVKWKKLKKIIIISSIKSHDEKPKSMKIAKILKLYNIIPTSFAKHINKLKNLSNNKKSWLNKRLELYETYLNVTNTKYLNWSFKQIVNWENSNFNSKIPLIHIHGDKDGIFPIENIKNCIVVPEGDHTLILQKHRWLNKELPQLILE